MDLIPINRRSFVAGAGAMFTTTLLPRAADAIRETDTLFATTCKQPDGSFAALLLDGKLKVLREIALPDRGHDITFNPVTGDGVVFARRPGNFAIAFNTEGTSKPHTIIADKGRHFYGHGVFSNDGRLLYATENDFENALGKIGIYDASDHFRRIGEFNSFGIGPHDLLLSPDGQTLICANGGIETHPDFGRTKLNLAFMKPNIAYIDGDHGSLRERHELPTAQHQLSIRHMAISNQGKVVFGCQYEGLSSHKPPLIGWSKIGEGIGTWDCLLGTLCQPANYIGSVAISRDGVAVAVSAPRDNAFALVSVKNGKLLRVDKLSGVCGVAAERNGFIASSDQGFLGPLHLPIIRRHSRVAFDNHLASRLPSQVRTH